MRMHEILTYMKKTLICNVFLLVYFVGPRFVGLPLAVTAAIFCFFDHPLDEFRGYVKTIKPEDEEWFILELSEIIKKVFDCSLPESTSMKYIVLLSLTFMKLAYEVIDFLPVTFLLFVTLNLYIFYSVLTKLRPGLQI